MEVLESAIKEGNMKPEVITKRRHTPLDGLFRYADLLGFGDIHVKFDQATGLKAIIAIHNLKRGPGLGGTRLVRYKATDDAIKDALRLAYMMSLKAALNNIPHGGAKSVIIAPKVIKDRKAYLESFADFVNVLGGRYITAVDSGTTMQDMDIIATRTPYVTCTTKYGERGNPSFHTAMGVRRGIEAAVKFKLGRDTLEGLHVAIQGAGHVGYYLAKELTALGVHLTMSDINSNVLQCCIDEFGVRVCAPELIHAISADIFAPCALGAVLNRDTINDLKASIIVGSANNQLAHHHYSVLLHERGILYAPDFVVNSGGLIFAAAMYDQEDFTQADKKVDDIYHTLGDIFARSKQENRTTSEVAEAIAIERLS